MSFRNCYNTLIKSTRLFFRNCWLSLIVVLFIVLLLTGIDQGGTLVIALLEDPLSLTLVLILTTGLSLVISHYPDYFFINNKYQNNFGPLKNMEGLTWSMNRSVFGFGLITYKDKQKYNTAAVSTYKAFKRLLGLSVFWAMLLILSNTYQKYLSLDELNTKGSISNQSIDVMVLTIMVIVTSGLLYWGMFSFLKNGNVEIRKRRRRWLSVALTILFWANILVFILALWSSWILGWNVVTFNLVFSFYLIAIVGFVIFRNIRNSLHGNLFAYPVSLLANHVNFLSLLAVLGWLALMILFLAQFFITAFNPILIVISILFTFYGLVVHPIKHKLYYNHLKNIGLTPPGIHKHNKIVSNLSIYISPIAFFLVLLGVLFSAKLGSQLHTLKPDKHETAIQEDEYRKRLYEKIETFDDKKIYFVASYGGGLTANIWNALVMNELALKYPKVFKQTISLSGVSGGAMGQGMFSSIYRTTKDSNNRYGVIERIALKNFLSGDIAWLFGKDLVRQPMFWVDEFKFDRAKRSMIEYQYTIDDPDLNTLSYRTYWKQLFDLYDFPVLLVNSTSTHSTRGIACPIVLNDFNVAFPASDDILSFQGSDLSISFSDALSTTNRFPILSPAAKIPTHGHYLDGGYFENSALLTTINFYEYLKSDTIWQSRFGEYEVIFIQIMNSKTGLMNELFKNCSTRQVLKTKETGELSAVLSTIGSIDGLPKYLNEDLSNKAAEIEYKYIALPYLLTHEDVKSYFKAKVLSEEVIQIVESHNSKVRRMRNKSGLSNWQLAEPPLARLLSTPAFDYMLLSIKDKETFKQLEDY